MLGRGRGGWENGTDGLVLLVNEKGSSVNNHSPGIAAKWEIRSIPFQNCLRARHLRREA